MAISECYCLLNSSICASNVSRLAPPRPIKILTLFIFAVFFFFFFFLNAMIDGVPIKPHSTKYEIPKPLSQVWSNWSLCRLPPSPGFGSCVSVFWPLRCFAACSLRKWASDCGNISHWGAGQEWKTIKPIQLSSLMRYSHSPGGSIAHYFYCVKSMHSQKRKTLCRVHILLVHRIHFSYCCFPLDSISLGRVFREAVPGQWVTGTQQSWGQLLDMSGLCQTAQYWHGL